MEGEVVDPILAKLNGRKTTPPATEGQDPILAKLNAGVKKKDNTDVEASSESPSTPQPLDDGISDSPAPVKPSPKPTEGNWIQDNYKTWANKRIADYSVKLNNDITGFTKSLGLVKPDDSKTLEWNRKVATINNRFSELGLDTKPELTDPTAVNTWNNNLAIFNKEREQLGEPPLDNSKAVDEYNGKVQKLNDFQTKRQQEYNQQFQSESQGELGKINATMEKFNKLQAGRSKNKDAEGNYLRLPLRGLVRSLMSTITDQYPGGIAAGVAGSMTINFAEDLLSKTDSPLVSDVVRQYNKQKEANPTHSTTAQELARHHADVEEAYRKQVGDEQYAKDKLDYINKFAKKKLGLLEYSDKQEKEAHEKLKGLPQSWEDAKGPWGIEQYIEKNLGQVAGLAIPTIAASAVHPGLGAVVGFASMGLMEKGEAFKEGITLLEQHTGLNREEIFATKADDLLQETSTKSGIVNGMLEYVGTVSVVGKFMPKSYITQLISKFAKNKGSQATVGTFVEALTEWVQAKDTHYAAAVGAGATHEDALKSSYETDDSEQFIAGLTGGGAMAFGSAGITALNRKNRYETIKEFRTARDEVKSAPQVINEVKATVQSTADATGVAQAAETIQEKVNEGGLPGIDLSRKPPDGPPPPAAAGAMVVEPAAKPIRRAEDVEYSDEEIQRQFRPIADQMTSVEREFDNSGLEISVHYDGETLVTDKKTGEIIDPEDLPAQLQKPAGQYEQAAGKLSSLDEQNFIKVQEQSRKEYQGEEAKFEEVTPPKLPDDLDALSNDIKDGKKPDKARIDKLKEKYGAPKVNTTIGEAVMSMADAKKSPSKEANKEEAISSVENILERTEDDLSIDDAVDEIESIDQDHPKYFDLQKAVKKYRDSQNESRTVWGQRDDQEQYQNEFISDVKKIIAGSNLESVSGVAYHGITDQDAKSKGIYLSDKSLATDYGDGKIGQYNYTLKKPYVVEMDSDFDTVNKIISDYRKTNPRAKFHPDTTDHVNKELEKLGYDGLIIKSEALDTEKGYNEIGGTYGAPQIIVFDRKNVSKIAKKDALPEGVDSPQEQGKFTSKGGNTVVDSNGEPLTVYHGTKRGGFQSFDPSEIKSKSRIGFFFTDKKQVAQAYEGSGKDLTGNEEYYDKEKELDQLTAVFAKHQEFRGEDPSDGLNIAYYKYTSSNQETEEDRIERRVQYDSIKKITGNKKLADAYIEKRQEIENKEDNVSSGIYSTNINLQNPFVIDFKNKHWNEGIFEGKRVTTNDITLIAAKRGHDGVIFKNIIDVGGSGKVKFKNKSDKIANVYVVFDKKNIARIPAPATKEESQLTPQTEKQKVFVYGTLKDDATRFKALGEHVETTDATIPGMIRKPGEYSTIEVGEGQVKGQMMELSPEQIETLDAYESNYDRKEVQPGVFAYVRKPTITAKGTIRLDKKGAWQRAMQKYHDIVSSSPRIAILKFFATGGKVNTKEAKTRTGLKGADLKLWHSKNGVTWDHLVAFAKEESRHDDADEGSIRDEIDGIISRSRAAVFEELRDIIAEPERQDFSMADVAEELVNDFEDAEGIIGVAANNEFIDDELTDVEKEQINAVLTEFTKNGEVQWDQITKEIKAGGFNPLLLNLTNNAYENLKKRSTQAKEGGPVKDDRVLQEEKGSRGEQKGPYQIAAEARIEKAQTALTAARNAYDEKKSKLGKSLKEDQVDIFGNREGDKGQLFQTGAGDAAQAKAQLEKGKQAIEKAQDELTNAKESLAEAITLDKNNLFEQNVENPAAALEAQQQEELRQAERPTADLNYIEDQKALEKKIQETVEDPDGETATREIPIAKKQAAIKKDMEKLKKLMDCIYG